MALTLTLLDTADTQILGRRLALAMAEHPFSILMTGPLGCGKTTLTRALVAALPGGADAEVSSPSFTICNFYPTLPVVAHCDLYRLGVNAHLPEEAREKLENGACVLIAEWAAWLSQDDLPEDYLEISFDFQPERNNSSRDLILAAHGPGASSCLERLR